MTLSKKNLRTVDIITPIYNEEEGIEQFYAALTSTINHLPYKFNIYYVNDGSSDRTQTILEQLAEKDKRIVVVELSRNFGHQAALTAGLDLAKGDVAITMDGDGQHPPEMIPEMLIVYQDGYDIVITQRLDNLKTSIFKRWTSSVFYWILNRLSDTRIITGAADFRLLSKAAVQSLKQMPEYHRFLRGMVTWMGFRSAILPYTPSGEICWQIEVFVPKDGKTGYGCHFFLLAGSTLDWPGCGSVLLRIGGC